MEVRTRIAPSPTGEDLHIGNLYTALINWAFARKNQGKFIIRVEDTDRERFIEGAEETILNSIAAFSLDPDESPRVGGPFAPYRQSERLEVYKKYADELVEKGLAYKCFCSKDKLEQIKNEEAQTRVKKKHREYCDPNATGDKYVIRLKVPENENITFNDLIRGDITISSNELDDQILIKSDGFPTYHLGVVVDDYLMKITHVIRAEEWISSTPKHIILYEAFKWDVPIFAHIPILRNPDRSKLSKRKNPVWASWYLEQGYLPEAILNYLALMGWSHQEGKDIFSIDEFIKYFELKDINSAGPIFDIVKLSWMNGEYIRIMDNQTLKSMLVDFYKEDKDVLSFMEGDPKTIDFIVGLAKTRMKMLKEFKDLVISKIPKLLPHEKNIAKSLYEKFSVINNWNKEKILSIMKEVLSTYKIKGNILYKIVTGFETGLPLPESLEILGKEKVLARLKKVTVCCFLFLMGQEFF